MSDNPKKKKLDGKRISQQPWEQAYQRTINGRTKKERVAPKRFLPEDADNHTSEKPLAKDKKESENTNCPNSSGARKSVY